MANVDTNKFYFDRKNYFLRFVSNEIKLDIKYDDGKLNSINNPIDRNIRHALEYFVDDLRRDRDKTIQRFLNEQTVCDIFRALAQLLLSNEERICGNSAYILGSAVESEIGLKRFLSVFSTDRTSNTVDVARVLCHLLTHSDSECVLNAAGTLGTICSSKDGRNYIVHHTCIAQIITNTSALLSSNNTWIASNAALVLARITVEEIGCQTILTHSKHREILNQLLTALNINDPNRSTNAAFAIGRLVEGDNGKKIFVTDCGQYEIFDALLLMLELHDEKGVNKNACYALSCLCTTHYGFQLCLQYLTTFRRILLAVEKILSTVEQETIWFALMCLRTIAQYDGASDHLCYSKSLPGKLKQIKEKWNKQKDIQDEAKLLWYMIYKNIKPNKPKIDECRNTSVDISWDLNAFSWNDDDEFQYRILLDNASVGITTNTKYTLKDLQANTNYSVQVQYITLYGESTQSDPTIFRTDDELPPAVSTLHLVRATMTAARIVWDLPDLSACNSFKGYQVYLNEAEHECTNECGITISSLTASTSYQVDICVITNKGKGPRSTLNFSTASAGDCLPPSPTFSLVGRREVTIKWQAPEVICGRLTRYELLCNGRCIYSGTDQEYHATMLKSDTEYTMEVIVITNEGRFRSKPAKTRTLKDNLTHRHSLYESPNQNSSKLKRTETIHTAHTTGTNHTVSKVSPPIDRHLSREVTIPSRNVDITSVQTLQFKPDNSNSNNHNNRSLLPGVVRSLSTTRPPINTTNTRTMHRTRTDAVGINQLQSPTRITASVIIPTLEIDHEPQTRWASPSIQKQTPSSSYRLSSSTTKPPIMMNGRKVIQRCASTSLPDLPMNLQRTQSFTQS